MSQDEYLNHSSRPDRVRYDDFFCHRQIITWTRVRLSSRLLCTRPELIHNCTRRLLTPSFSSICLSTSPNFSISSTLSTSFQIGVGTELLVFRVDGVAITAAIMNVLLSPQPPLFPHNHDTARLPSTVSCTHTYGILLSDSLLTILTLFRRPFLPYHEQP